MKTIQATEFIRPNARRELVEYNVSDEAFEKFQLLQKFELILTVEDLQTGLYCLCIDSQELGTDYETELCLCKDIEKTFERMLLSFSERDFESFKESLELPADYGDDDLCHDQNDFH